MAQGNGMFSNLLPNFSFSRQNANLGNQPPIQQPDPKAIPGGHPGNPVQNPSPGNTNLPNGNPPAGNPKGNDPQNMQDPLQVYANMWQPATPDQNNAPPEFNINPDTMKRVVDGMDFSQDLPQELMERMQSGEQPTWQDLIAVMNHTGRRAYSNAMTHQSKLTEKFVGLYGEHAQKNLPQHLRKYLTTAKVRGLPTVQGNPVVQQHLEQIAQRIAEKNPDASDEWITEQAKSYFTNMARALDPDSFQSQGPNGSGQKQDEIDWDSFMLSGRDQ